MSRHIVLFIIICLLLLANDCLAEDVSLSDDLKGLGSIGLKVKISHREESFLAKNN